MTRYAVAFAVLLMLVSGTQVAHAQLLLPGSGGTLFVRVEPAYPAPGDTVRLTLTSALFDLGASEITWSADGTSFLSGTGETRASITAGELGETSLIRVDVSGEESASTEVRITPGRVDLLWEADSYVPPYFEGRPLPSDGASLRLFAQPYLPKGEGLWLPNELVYTWKRDGAVISSASGKGKTSLVLPAPEAFGTATVSVEVHVPDKSVAASASVTVRSVDPILALYRNHPLSGVEYFRALGSTTFIPENEMAFTAIPYFASAWELSDTRLKFAWRVNRTAVPADPTRPNEITINANRSDGLALIELLFTHATNFAVEAAGRWNITFNSADSPDEGNIFRGSQ